MAQTIIFNQSDIETVQPTSTCNEFANEIERIDIRFRRALTIPRIYRRQLRMYRSVAQFIDRHPALFNLWIGGWSVVFFIYIYMYA